jgi:galactokinase
VTRPSEDPTPVLRAAGYDASGAESRAALMDQVRRRWEQTIGTPPAWRWCVPGRIEVFGKHTDYAGGESLLAAVPRGFAVAAGPRSDGRVRVIDARHGESTELHVSDTTQVWRGWANYVAVTARRLAANFPGAALGADIVLASDLPRAAGLSSSSALVVGVASALIRRAGLDRRDDWRAAIESVDDLAWYLGCVENGLTYRTLPGADGVGTHGGSQDHTAILTCRPGRLSHYGFMPVRSLGEAAMPAAWRFVVASSGVHADKAGSVRDRYNRASLAVRALLAIWNASAAVPAASLAAALATGGEAEQRLRHAVQRTQATDFTADDLERRLSQLTRELPRIGAAAAAFSSADAAALGALTRASQHDAEHLLGNQVPETVALCELAREMGAIAASAFGAGFGGSVWAVVPAEAADTFGPEWLARYRMSFPHRSTADWFAAMPGPGAVELPV